MKSGIVKERIYSVAIIIIWALVLLLLCTKPVPAAEIDWSVDHESVNAEDVVQESEIASDVAKKQPVLVKEPDNPYREIIDGLSEEDFLLLGQVVYREAGNSTHECQAAVVITVLNRIMDPAWPGTTVREIVYAPGQFATAGKLAGTVPTQAQLDAIEEVRRTGNRVLQDAIDAAGLGYDAEEVVYFSTNRKMQRAYARDFVRIGGHDYGRAR